MTTDRKPPDQQLAVCRHCGNKTLHELLHKATLDEYLHDDKGETIGVFENFYFLTKCATCSGVSLFTSWEHSERPNDLLEAGVLYPSERRYSGDVPKPVELAYSEASKVKKISPVAFSVMVRRALEFLCKERGAKGGNLKERIAALAALGVIPDTLAKMADAIRGLANDGAHEMEAQVSEKDADDLNYFFAAVIEYVYVAPKRLDELQARMTANKAAGQAKP